MRLPHELAARHLLPPGPAQIGLSLTRSLAHSPSLFRARLDRSHELSVRLVQAALEEEEEQDGEESSHT